MDSVACFAIRSLRIVLHSTFARKVFGELLTLPSSIIVALDRAASEYITLSGHVDWLVDSSVPYYSTRASSVSEGGDDALILDHMRTAFNHLSKVSTLH
tara:strand:+ start:149 stop:445 length:297 start_codon:yes stop_codon:yes gene_type:complete